MEGFDKCPICGGELKEKKVEKVLRGGNNTAIITVDADVCLHCGERLYSQATIKEFEKIRKLLIHEDVDTFQEIGRSYKVGV